MKLAIFFLYNASNLQLCIFMNHAFLSLEQKFALRVLSIQIQKNTDMMQLQDELTDLFEAILIKHQSLKDNYYFSIEDKEEIESYLRASQTFVSELEIETTMICSCIDSIRNTYDVEELQALLIEANEISMMQRNYSDFIAQYMTNHKSMI